MDRLQLVERLAQLELQQVDTLIELVAHASDSELDALRNQTDDGLDDFAEEANELFAIREVFSQLSAVALYAVVEIRTKSALGTRASKSELAGAFRFENLKSLFAKYSGQELPRLAEFASIDELRCINNCYKHRGTVDAHLARYSGWTLGAPLGDVQAAVARLRSKVPAYLSAFVSALR